MTILYGIPNCDTVKKARTWLAAQGIDYAFHDYKKAGVDAAAMEAMAKAQPGYLSFKSYASDDGETIALSEWADEAAARAWGRHAEHAVIQGKGRSEYYSNYTLFACANPRIHRFARTTV